VGGGPLGVLVFFLGGGGGVGGGGGERVRESGDACRGQCFHNCTYHRFKEWATMCYVSRL